MTDHQPPTVVVPREPTEAMIEAGKLALSSWVSPAMHADDAYRAMINIAHPDCGGDGRTTSPSHLIEALDEAQVALVAAANRLRHEGFAEAADALDCDAASALSALVSAPAQPPAALDEAVGLLTDLVSWFTVPVAGGVWMIPAGDGGADDAIEATRAFLANLEPSQ